MGSQAFFASRWVIVAIWFAGVLPLVLLAAGFGLMTEWNVAVFFRAVLGLAGMGIGVLFLAAAWRVAAYPLLTISEREIIIIRPFSRRRATTLNRHGISQVKHADKHIVFKMLDGSSWTVRMTLVPAKDRDCLRRLFPFCTSALAA